MSPRAKVYILGFPNGKCYVGITIKAVGERFGEHVRDARSTSQYAIHCALRKYGPENVKLMTVATGVSWTQAQDLEIWWISRLTAFGKSGYNMTAGGDGTVGHRHTKVARANMSKARKAFEATPGGKVARTKTSRAMMGNTRTAGRKLSAEHKAKIGKACTNPSDATRAKISKARMGHKVSAETRALMSKAGMGRITSPETRAKISKALMGGTHNITDETKAKIGRASKAYAAIRQKELIAEMVGKTFSRWTVLSCNEEETLRTGVLYFTCRCTCGVEKSVLGNSLRRGGSKGCRSCFIIGSRGCKRTPAAKANMSKAQTTRHREAAAKENHVTIS